MGKTKKIIVSMIIFLAILLFSKSAYAMTQQDAGQALAEFSIYFYQHYGARTLYSVEGRETTYTGSTVGGYYKFDCVGWVDFAVHQSLKLGGPTMSYFAVPPGGGNTPYYRNGFECIKGDVYNANNLLSREEVEATVQPGDILFCGPEGPHVVIYVGDHNIIHCYSNLECEDLYDNDMHYTGYCAIGRITKDTAAGIDQNNVITMFTGEGYDEKGLPYEGSKDFKFKGTTSGSYKGSTSVLSWLFENLLGFCDYLIGMLFYIVRAPFVGWANIIEYMVNDTINDLSGIEMSGETVKLPVNNDSNEIENNTDPNNPDQNNTEDNNEDGQVKVRYSGFFIPTANDMYEVDGSKRINIERIIYNEVPILDVDIFDVDLSDYEGSEIITVSEDSVIYKLRENIAIWYYAIRSVSLVSMVIVLIYLGIRLAISTTAGTKAKYKGMLSAWVTSFIIIFFIHYFMIAVIEVNDVLLDVFKAEEIKYTGGLSMFDTIRTRAYSIKLSEGIPATIMYMVLIYYLIRFLFIYVKRYFTVNILALMGPIMGIKYAIDKINKGKSGTMGTWMYDFALNVLIQSVHAIIYTIFMAIAFEVGMESIPGFILALFILNFIFDAEKIFLNVFKFDSRASSLRDVNKNTNYFLEAYKISKGIAVFPGFAFGLVKNTTKGVGNVVLDSTQALINFHNLEKWRKEARTQNGAIEDYKAIDVRVKLKEQIEKMKDGAAGWADDKLYNITGVRSLKLGLRKLKKTDKKAYYATKALLDENAKLKKEVTKRYLSSGVKSIKTIATLTTSIPMMVVDPKEGFTAFTTNLDNVIEFASGKSHYGHRSKKEIRSRRGRIAATVFTGVGAYAVFNAQDNVKELQKDRRKIAKNENMLADLREAHLLEEKIEEQVQIINKHLEETKQNVTEDEAKKMEEAIDKIKADTIERTLNEVLKSKNISNVVKEYMERNNLEKLSGSDIESIIREFNIHNIQSEIKSLKDTSDGKIEKLQSKLADLEEQLRTGIDRENNAINRDRVRAQITREKGKIEQIEEYKKVVEEVGQAIQSEGILGEGMFIEKHNIEKLVKEYAEGKQQENATSSGNTKVSYKFEESDIRKIVVTFNERVQVSESSKQTSEEGNNQTHTSDEKTQENVIPIYASKDDIKEHFVKRGKKVDTPKELDREQTVNAILDANNKYTRKKEELRRTSQENGGAQAYDEYSLISDLLRDLETLNQKSINTHNRSVTNISKMKKIIKDNNFKK